jgi:hypothetical protein
LIVCPIPKEVSFTSNKYMNIYIWSTESKKERGSNLASELGAAWCVPGWAIFSAAGLMAFALFIQSYDVDMVNATKDVLPLATGLVGFASGAATAIFGKSIK